MTNAVACRAALAALLFLSMPASAQDSSRAATELAAARRMLMAGELGPALERIDVVLKGDPANREAVALKVDALLRPDRFADALVAYDAYTTTVNRPDASLLAVIGRAELQRVVRESSETSQRVSALERLVRDGDAESRGALRQLAGTAAPRDRAVVDLALAQLADPDATRRLIGLLESASGIEEKAAAIRAVQSAGIRSLAPAVARFLTDADPPVRSAGAVAVGLLGYADAVPRLEAMFKDDAHVVRMHAAVALKRLGRTTADLYLADMLKNPMAEVRLLAAEAFQQMKSTQWVRYVRSALSDPNGLNRLRAAELLAGADPEAARAALHAIMRGDNPFLRADAARILETKGLADLAMTRRMLGDEIAPVRLHGAGAALALARQRPR